MKSDGSELGQAHNPTIKTNHITIADLSAKLDRQAVELNGPTLNFGISGATTHASGQRQVTVKSHLVDLFVARWPVTLPGW